MGSRSEREGYQTDTTIHTRKSRLASPALRKLAENGRKLRNEGWIAPNRFGTLAGEALQESLYARRPNGRLSTTPRPRHICL
jgi:hypothetical protein